MLPRFGELLQVFQKKMTVIGGIQELLCYANSYGLSHTLVDNDEKRKKGEILASNVVLFPSKSGASSDPVIFLIANFESALGIEWKYQI